MIDRRTRLAKALDERVALGKLFDCLDDLIYTRVHINPQAAEYRIAELRKQFVAVASQLRKP